MKNLIEKVMSRREAIDSKANAVDRQHDLPVYRRLRQMFTSLLSSLQRLSTERQKSFHSLIEVFFRFDQTVSPLLTQLTPLIVTHKEKLGESFQQILTFLAGPIASPEYCPFVQQLQTSEKLEFIQWFTVEKHRSVLVFDLLRQLRLSKDLILRQRAMEYNVPWSDQSTIDDDGRSSVSEMS